MRNIRSNLWKIYIYKFLSEFYLIAPILIPYYKSNLLNSTQIFTVQAAYALSILIFEVPSGFLADSIGRKKTLILGAVFFPLGIGIYVLTSSFYTFILAEFILAVANSMRSGCDSALIYDTLIQMKKASEYKKFEGRSFFFTRIGTSLSSVAGGTLALVSLQTPFFINIITGSLMLPIALLLQEPQREKMKSSQPFKAILKICRFSFSHGPLRILILFTALVMSTGITGVWAYFLHYEALGFNVGYFGILFAVFQLASAWGSSQTYRLEKILGSKKSLLILLFTAPNLVLLGLFKSVFLLPLIFINAFLWGFSFPLCMDYLNRIIKSDIRATVLSVANMTGSLAFAVLSPLFGKLVDAFSLSMAFMLLGIYFFILGSILISLILHHREEFREC